jgi:hypothetical protein
MYRTMSESFIPVNDEEAAENVQEFIEEHGLEGFLVLHTRQMVYRFVKQEFLSADEEVDDISLQMHFDAEGDDALHDKRDELLYHCERWARDLVDRLKEDEVIGDVIANDDFERLDEEQVYERWQNEYHDTLEQWRDEAELDSESPDSQTELPHEERDDS